MKIFGIGLPRTGTTSLSIALCTAGYKTAHTVFAPHLYDIGDAFTDTPIYCDYKELDTRYPNSKFILTTRDVDSWLISIERYFNFFTKERLPQIINGKTVGAKIDLRVYQKTFGQFTFDKNSFRERFKMHENEAREYFRERDEHFTIVDITSNNVTENLSNFLGNPILSFPKTNIGCNSLDWWKYKHPNKLPSWIKTKQQLK